MGAFIVTIAAIAAALLCLPVNVKVLPNLHRTIP